MKQKKIKMEKRPRLDKESIVKLQESQLAHIKGGNQIESLPSCAAYTCNAFNNKVAGNGPGDYAQEQ